MRRAALATLTGLSLAAATLAAVPAQAADPAHSKLARLVTLKNVRHHQLNLQKIADANGGNRAAGLPGSEITIKYIADQLERAGYSPTVQNFTFDFWQEKSEAVFPYSLVGTPAGEAEVKRALTRRLVVMVGEKDAEPDEDPLAAGAKAQGEGRIDRGETFIKAATAAAGELGAALAWELHELPATAGDGAAASRAASEIMFPKR